jgi:pyruvate dehydrogenase E2 component (dihydrolipoamide acetyltransferase)
MSEPETEFTVVIPKLGLTMTEATILEWHKREGEAVRKGEVLFTLENEKSTLEIEAPASGILHILVEAGQTVPVLGAIGRLVGAEAEGRHLEAPAAAPLPPAARELSPLPAAPTHPAASAGPLRASPKARAEARRRGVSLASVAGTGPRGMVVAGDVPAAPAPLRASPVARKMAAEASLDLTGVPGTGPRGMVMRRDIERVLTEPAPAAPQPLPLSGLRGIIAERLSAGWRERPQVTITTEADATNLVSARQQMLAETGEKIAYDAFLVKCVARALAEHPALNARLGPSGIELLPNINVGVAVDTERGLLVPVVQGAPRLSLRQVQAQLQTLAERARAGRSLPDDLAGGTFTITNLGMYEIDAFTPIINPPECAILGVGRIVARPVGLNGQVVLRDMLALSLSFDHRLVDGGPAARFLQRIKQLVERPFALFAGD